MKYNNKTKFYTLIFTIANVFPYITVFAQPSILFLHNTSPGKEVKVAHGYLGHYFFFVLKVINLL